MAAAEHIVTFEPSGESVSVPAGTTLRDAAALAGVALSAPCGGLGTCGRCVVHASGELEPAGVDELTLLASERLAAGERLACRARVAGDVTVTVPPTGRPVRIIGAAVSSEAEGAGPAHSERLGLAIDIGTTTLAAELVGLDSGRRAGSAVALNPQRTHGADVMSRITAAATVGIEALRAPLLAAIRDLAGAALAGTGRDIHDVARIALCGNTTMIHTLLGLDPAPLGHAPYRPAFLDAVERSAAELGLPGGPGAVAVVLPGASAFVGADAVAGVVATRLDEAGRPTMLLDLGTNGEIVLRTPEGLLAASTAAGPAMEGATISSGMLAEEGAIERVTLQGDGLVIGTIAGAPARGICGSGLIDLMAALLDAGVVDQTGLLRPDAPHALAVRVRDASGVREFEVSRGVELTQIDIRQLQLAIGAVAAGVRELLDAAGTGADDVAGLVVAGGFGAHLRPKALARLGCIPRQWTERTSFAGNAALAGATAVLLDPEALRRARAVAAHTTTVDLASRPTFQGRFIAAMTFPQGPGADV